VNILLDEFFRNILTIISIFIYCCSIFALVLVLDFVYKHIGKSSIDKKDDKNNKIE